MLFSKLPNDKHLGAGTQIWDIIADFEVATQPLLGERKTIFHNAVLAEDSAYKRSPKDFNSDDMHKADDFRDDFMQAVRMILQGYTLLPDISPLKRMAEEMYQVFKDYKFSTGDSYTGQSVKMDNMWQVFSENQSKLETLGVWSLLEQAMVYNAQVKSYFAARIDQLSTRVVGEMRDARAATDQAYQQLCDVLDAMSVLTPSAELSALERRLNALVDYYKQYYIRSSSGSSGSSSSSSGSGTEQGGGSEQGGGTEQGGGSEQGGTTNTGDDDVIPGSGGGEVGGDDNQGGGSNPTNPSNDDDDVIPGGGGQG